MILKDKDDAYECAVLAAIVGRRCTTIELDALDFRVLSELSPLALHEWLTITQTRFAPKG